MAPQDGSAGVSFGQQGLAGAGYGTEPKRMRLSGAGDDAAESGSSTTRARPLTNKGSHYKAQRGRAVTAAKAKAPATHRRRGRRGKSVYRGVCVTREGKWRAVIYKERKQLYLGVYESEVDAAKAHDRAARFHFAESAVCNFDSEHEADRQAEIHRQRQLVQQQQLAEDRAHHAQLHGGTFSVGREEFDDLEEYHRGMDEATAGGCSSEEDDGGAGGAGGDHRVEEEEEEEEGAEEHGMMHDDGDENDHHHDEEEGGGGDMSEDDVEGQEEEGEDGDGLGRSARSMSSSYSSAMSTGDMSDGGAGGRGSGHSRSKSVGDFQVTAAAVAAAAAAFAAPAATPAGSAGAAGGGDGGRGMHVQQQQQQQQQPRSRCSSGTSDCSGDFVRPSLMREVSQTSTQQEGMGFPVAEDLLGYEMQSWYCCQDDEDHSPASCCSGGEHSGELFESQLQKQQPFMGRQQQQQQQQQQQSSDPELWGSAVGANLGWGFGDFAQTYSDGGSRSSSGSMSSSNFSCDDEYVPSALPPLMGISAGEA